jgi:hypothetical protein
LVGRLKGRHRTGSIIRRLEEGIVAKVHALRVLPERRQLPIICT